MTDVDIVSLQIRSVIIFEFLNEYNKFENTVRKTFEKNIPSLPANILQKLYFYNGGRIGTYIDYGESSVKLNVASFKEDDLFKELTINQIIKIFKADSYISDFDFCIESLQKATVTIPFFNCAICLINMRNKLAHELVDIEFKNRDSIDLLTLDQIEEQNFRILQNFDIKKMDNTTQYIASNIIYMKKVINTLENENEG